MFYLDLSKTCKLLQCVFEGQQIYQYTTGGWNCSAFRPDWNIN